MHLRVVGTFYQPCRLAQPKSINKYLRPDRSAGFFKALFEAIEREQEARGTL